MTYQTAMDVQEYRAAIHGADLTFTEAGKRMGISEATMRRLVAPSRKTPVPLRYVLALSAVIE